MTYPSKSKMSLRAAGLDDDELESLSQLMRLDYTLSRQGLSADLFSKLGALADSSASVRLPLVYSAFDGDHFGLTALMKRWITSRSAIPVHPESVLGYKEAVDAHREKRGVLLDDLALVSRCDEMVVFTDVVASPAAVAAGLAEGALLELCYFLKLGRPVRFVKIRDMLSNRRGAPRPISFNYSELAACLGGDQGGIAKLILDLSDGAVALPKIAYILHDPLDSKYLDWFRRDVYRNNRVPLVPYFAVDPIDFADSTAQLAQSLVAWTQLLRVADELFFFPSFDVGRRPSGIVDLLTSAWGHRARPTLKAGWTDLEIPKLIVGANWSITERESGA